jgi:hypothetical protein
MNTPPVMNRTQISRCRYLQMTSRIRAEVLGW